VDSVSARPPLLLPPSLSPGKAQPLGVDPLLPSGPQAPRPMQTDWFGPGGFPLERATRGAVAESWRICFENASAKAEARVGFHCSSRSAERTAAGSSVSHGLGFGGPGDQLKSERRSLNGRVRGASRRGSGTGRWAWPWPGQLARQLGW